MMVHHRNPESTKPDKQETTFSRATLPRAPRPTTSGQSPETPKEDALKTGIAEALQKYYLHLAEKLASFDYPCVEDYYEDLDDAARVANVHAGPDVDPDPQVFCSRFVPAGFAEMAYLADVLVERLDWKHIVKRLIGPALRLSKITHIPDKAFVEGALCPFYDVARRQCAVAKHRPYACRVNTVPPMDKETQYKLHRALSRPLKKLNRKVWDTTRIGGPQPFAPFPIILLYVVPFFLPPGPDWQWTRSLIREAQIPTPAEWVQTSQRNGFFENVISIAEGI